MKKVMIFYAAYGGGHLSAARSIKENIETSKEQHLTKETLEEEISKTMYINDLKEKIRQFEEDEKRLEETVELVVEPQKEKKYGFSYYYVIGTFLFSEKENAIFVILIYLICLHIKLF